MPAIHETSLAGRVAVVTGSGQNIGAAIARRLAEAGAAVVVNGHSSKENVERTVSEIREAGGRAVGIMADISEPNDVKRLVAEANAAFGPVDIAVSNVGRRLHKPFEDITIEDWDWAIRTNLSSCFYLAHHVIPAMKQRQWGRVIHVSGFDGFTGHMANRAYNIAAKSGMHGFTKAVARELGPFGITANTVVPGAIDTVRDWSRVSRPQRRGRAQRDPRAPARPRRRHRPCLRLPLHHGQLRQRPGAAPERRPVHVLRELAGDARARRPTRSAQLAESLASDGSLAARCAGISLPPLHGAHGEMRVEVGATRKAGQARGNNGQSRRSLDAYCRRYRGRNLGKPDAYLLRS